MIIQRIPIVVTTLLTLSLLGCGDEKMQSRERPPQNIVAQQVNKQLLEQQVHAIGHAKANESVVITTKIAGRLDKVLFEDGQKVAKGDVLIHMDQDEEQAQLSSAKVQLAEHQREINRLKKLLARNAAPVRDLDERKTLVAITENSIKELEARLSEMTLTAPFDGQVGIRNVSPGTLIQPGTVITTLVQSNPIKVDFAIPASQLQGIAIGNTITATTSAIQNATFTGTITAMDAQIDAATGSMMLRAQIENNSENSSSRIIPGMLLSISVSQTAREAIMIPEEAITQKQDQHFVTVVSEQQTAEVRPVTIGARTFGTVEITNGLSDGEVIIIRGMEFAKQGAKVNITNKLEQNTEETNETTQEAN